MYCSEIPYCNSSMILCILLGAALSQVAQYTCKGAISINMNMRFARLKKCSYYLAVSNAGFL